ncbi:MAG: rod shape-determining protein MreC [Bacteroidetes bacterium GWF2_42_66]|nr:MAG: rod shape-determining protein MreC [Bacteroidetes bacterium GWA2_42_15]OFY03561.1 MAG: rod shape-determining protein MreC [Bacteroidetes bacterium GWE2_42_39]OFY45926.1 MAG: rod shape-determining protein MreC [Bacteroidetes bacterium GWF2_42_66]HBL75168.1 rod shape-determining protein MreC [Prolixibacteraceae bacterium]HCR89719.1 rod shape-determining protein MreC [Prolixibacteraceae bacterium]
MRNLLRLILRYHSFLLFLFFEIISLILIVSYNNYQRVKFLNSSVNTVGSIYELNNSFNDYFHLKRINDELAAQNTFLRNMLQDRVTERFENRQVKDTLSGKIFTYISAQVVNNSVNKQYNYLTINKGYIHGIKPDMGIINSEGVVGVINHVSKNYSTGISILNKRLFISAKIKNSGTYGSLVWDGISYRNALLREIPIHIPITLGDTIVTSGYSAIFPEGIMVGTIQSFDIRNGENYYTIDVDLSTNFKTVSYVEVVQNVKQIEIRQLEKKNEND